MAARSLLLSQANNRFLHLLSSPPLIHRRGYAVVASDDVTVKNGGLKNITGSTEIIQRREGDDIKSGTATTTTTEQPVAYSSYWAPDPITGYYRPNNSQINEIDPAEEFRMMILKPKPRSRSSST